MSDAPKGHAVAVWGSTGMLELAINGGNISDVLNRVIGSHIAVYDVDDA
jgi:S-adenosylmethionine hydrolase